MDKKCPQNKNFHYLTLDRVFQKKRFIKRLIRTHLNFFSKHFTGNMNLLTPITRKQCFQNNNSGLSSCRARAKSGYRFAWLVPAMVMSRLVEPHSYYYFFILFLEHFLKYKLLPSSSTEISWKQSVTTVNNNQTYQINAKVMGQIMASRLMVKRP